MKKLIELVTGRKYAVSGGFWNSDSTYPKSLKPHIGTDYPLNQGTPLYVPTYVHVIAVSGHVDYGKQIFLYDPNNDVTHHFAHLESLSAEIRVGDGRYIGYEFGKSGRSGKGFDGQVISNGVVPHLHYGLAKGRVTSTSKGIGKNGESTIWLSVEDFNLTPSDNDGAQASKPSTPSDLNEYGQKVKVGQNIEFSVLYESSISTKELQPYFKKNGRGYGKVKQIMKNARNPYMVELNGSVIGFVRPVNTY